MLIHYTTSHGDHDSTRPPTLAPLVLGVNYALLFVAVLLVSARIVAKSKLRKLAIEDALIVIATVITISLVAITTVAVKYGFGRHLVDVDPEWWPVYSKISYASIVLGATCFPLTKLSMLFFYLRLAPQPTYRIVCFLSIGYIAVSSTVCIMINIFACHPIRGGWDHSTTLHTTCLDAPMFYYVYCSMNIATDILLMVLPIPIIIRLQLKPNVKLGLVAMFAAGLLITGIGAFTVQAMYAAYHGNDVIWDGAYSWMWAMIEFNMSIIIACMPSMLLFAKWVRGDIEVEMNPKSTVCSARVSWQFTAEMRARMQERWAAL